MQSQVIVPLDGSASAEAILPHALLFAQRGQSILTLLQIVTPSGLPGVRDRMIPDNWSEGEEIFVAEGEEPISDSPEEKAQLLRTTTGLRVETAATGRDPEAFIEQLTGHG